MGKHNNIKITEFKKRRRQAQKLKKKKRKKKKSKLSVVKECLDVNNIKEQEINKYIPVPTENDSVLSSDKKIIDKTGNAN